MGLNTLVFAVLLASVVYVLGGPLPSDSSESKSQSMESLEVSKSHSDESTSASTDKHDEDHIGHVHKREVTPQSTTLMPEISTSNSHPSTGTSQVQTALKNSPPPVPAAASTVSASPALPSTTTAPSFVNSIKHTLEFYPLQTLFP